MATPLACPSCSDTNLQVHAVRLVNVILKYGKEFYAGDHDEYHITGESKAICTFCQWVGKVSELVSAR